MLQNQPVTNWQTERVNHKYHNLSDNILQWDNKYNVQAEKYNNDNEVGSPKYLWTRSLAKVSVVVFYSI